MFIRQKYFKHTGVFFVYKDEFTTGNKIEIKHNSFTKSI